MWNDSASDVDYYDLNAGIFIPRKLVRDFFLGAQMMVISCVRLMMPIMALFFIFADYAEIVQENLQQAHF